MNKSLENSIRQREIDLGRSLRNRSKVYLDTKFWIIARDVEAGVRTGAPDRELIRLLRQGIRTGKLSCPISESVFYELMKQEDVTSRQKTANIIDEFSSGLALIPLDLRIATEIQHAFGELSGKSADEPLDNMVWTKLGCIFRDPKFAPPNIDKISLSRFHRSYFEAMWRITVTEMVERPTEFSADNVFQILAASINAANADHSAELKSFDEVYAHEARGAGDIGSREGLKVIGEMSQRFGGNALVEGSSEWNEISLLYRNLIAGILISENHRTKIPTLHVQASIHANIRWDKARQIKVNDFYDFDHAAAAIPYCDALLTERSLTDLSYRKTSALAETYKCKVAAKTEDANEIIDKLIR